MIVPANMLQHAKVVVIAQLFFIVWLFYEVRTLILTLTIYEISTLATP
jgi:hypothetical protein